MYSRHTENPPSLLCVAELSIGQAHDKVVNNAGQGIALKRVLVVSKQVHPIVHYLVPVDYKQHGSTGISPRINTVGIKSVVCRYVI